MLIGYARVSKADGSQSLEHIQSRVTEFSLTDLMQALRPILLSTMHRGPLAAGPVTGQSGRLVDVPPP